MRVHELNTSQAQLSQGSSSKAAFLPQEYKIQLLVFARS